MMLEMGTSGLMSGEGKQPAASRSRPSALPRLYAFRNEYLAPHHATGQEGGPHPHLLKRADGHRVNSLPRRVPHPLPSAGPLPAGRAGSDFRPSPFRPAPISSTRLPFFPPPHLLAPVPTLAP